MRELKFVLRPLVLLFLSSWVGVVISFLFDNYPLERYD